MGRYKINKKWRLSHTRLRNADRKRYYKKHRYGHNSRVHYTRKEQRLIRIKRYLGVKVTDVFIAKMLGRSVQGIQLQRWRLKHGSSS
jgi:hypothetical protein